MDRVYIVHSNEGLVDTMLAPMNVINPGVRDALGTFEKVPVNMFRINHPASCSSPPMSPYYGPQ